MYHYQDKLGQWKPENMAAAVKEERENAVSNSSKKKKVPRNTLRMRLIRGSVSKRQLGLGTANVVIYFWILTDVRELAFQSAENNGLTHKFNLQRK
jgi:hypothetical protein